MESLSTPELAALLAFIALAAALYSSVGHGGASGYLAAMALFGIAPVFMKPAALAMNIAVAGLVFYRLWRAGHFDARLFWPFALGSIPLAFVGGALTLPGGAYKMLVAVALLVAASRLLWKSQDHPASAMPKTWVALAVGAGLGFLSGLTGVGGGIFLSPLLLLLRWANMRATAAVSAAFILVLPGLPGMQYRHRYNRRSCRCSCLRHWPVLIGSELAVRRLAPVTLRRVLGVVLSRRRQVAGDGLKIFINSAADEHGYTQIPHSGFALLIRVHLRLSAAEVLTYTRAMRGNQTPSRKRHVPGKQENKTGRSDAGRWSSTSHGAWPRLHHTAAAKKSRSTVCSTASWVSRA